VVPDIGVADERDGVLEAVGAGVAMTVLDAELDGAGLDPEPAPVVLPDVPAPAGGVEATGGGAGIEPPPAIVDGGVVGVVVPRTAGAVEVGVVVGAAVPTLLPTGVVVPGAVGAVPEPVE
jgi:hypothetical protein